MKRAVLIGLGAVLVVVAAGVLFLYSSLESIVQTAVERVGSDVTGTEVSLNDVEISPESGEGALIGFRMTNPKGFGAGDAFRFDAVRVTIDASTIASDPVVIKEVVVAAPEITYVIGERGSNLDRIRQNVDAYGGGAGGKGGDSAGSSGDEGPRIVIENLYFKGGEVGVVAPSLTEKRLSAPLPDIHLTDIGKNGNGATPAEIARQSIDAVLAAATTAVGRLDLSELAEGAGQLAKGAGAAAGQAAEKTKDAVKDAAGRADGAIKDASGKLKKLLDK